jgi:hypothetical protein
MAAFGLRSLVGETSKDFSTDTGVDTLRFLGINSNFSEGRELIFSGLHLVFKCEIEIQQLNTVHNQQKVHTFRVKLV